MNSKIVTALAASAAVVVAGCAAMQGPTDPALEAKAVEMMKVSFKEKGQAKLDRLNQDQTQALCSQYAGKELPKDVAATIEKSNLATIRYPQDGKLVGDWKQGERIAQSGYGMRFTDYPPTQPNGGNCYACHQLSKAEVSYGTIGPSLLGYGANRKFSEADTKAVYEKIYNSHAVFPCSLMPRFGTNGVLSIEQIKDLTALVMSPDSPVNK